MVKVISIDSLLEERRKGTFQQDVPFVVNGEQLIVVKKIVNGEMETLEFVKPFGEMLTSGSLQQFKDLMKKTVLDVEIGREAVPLLYKPIYETITDPSFPQVIDAKWALYGTVVFTDHMEGEEIKFGALNVEHGPVARILTQAAAFEITKEVKEFNSYYIVEIYNKSMGEAHNAKLNDMHLGPFVNFGYPKAANKTAYQGEASDALWVRIYKTLNQAVADAQAAKRPASILLASSLDKANIEMALKGGYTINGTTYPAVDGITTVIYYDGWTTTVGKKTYTYTGVAQGDAYLIRPRRGFKELIKKDLTIESATADLSRLIEAQIVGYSFRGVYAAVEENVQKIALK
ncbi:aspartate ammonia-lyase [Paenibacillus sp. HN-1]|uniref:hypothetical protein n=1 Tax=Paenibacillus TaxID=44249 RepID=UPI001CA8827B|nr:MULTISPECIES: hypothetical protein [Paenibacillus]MBY9081002.1 aspartate ammonia-lyase [Paenibacillus sp. CGMCC 1.18879]MBY9084104.1 aspartate ammonia-lyase [Paenibacillus sinensis]